MAAPASDYLRSGPVFQPFFADLAPLCGQPHEMSILYSGLNQ
jgi:hypothetical protein